MEKAIVLVEPEKPENTGLIARLASNYKYSLRLVNPCFNLSKARKTASNYQEKLRNVKIFDSLEKALEGLEYAVGTKPGKGVEISNFNTGGNISPVIGRESSGLTNEELEKCDATVHIQTPGENSLNQATATAIILDSLKEVKGQEKEKIPVKKFACFEQKIDSKLLVELLRRSNPDEDEINRLMGELD